MERQRAKWRPLNSRHSVRNASSRKWSLLAMGMAMCLARPAFSEADSVTLTVNPFDTSYISGDQVNVRVTVLNSSAQNMAVGLHAPGREIAMFRWTITDQKGEAVPSTSLGRFLFPQGPAARRMSGGSMISTGFAAGSCTDLIFALDRVFDLTKPGRYTLTAELAKPLFDMGSNAGWQWIVPDTRSTGVSLSSLRPKSNTVSFLIREPGVDDGRTMPMNAPGGQAAGTTASPSRVPDLTLALEAGPRDRLGATGPVVVKATLANTTSDTMTFRPTISVNWNRGLRLEVTDSSGKLVPFTAYAKALVAKGPEPNAKEAKIVRLAPGQCYEQRIYVGRFYDVSDRGQYKIVAIWCADGEQIVRSEPLAVGSGGASMVYMEHPSSGNQGRQPSRPAPSTPDPPVAVWF